MAQKRPRGEIGFLNLIAYCTGFATAPIAAYASDRWGRRLCLRYAALTMVVGSVMGTCAGEGGASAYGLFLGSRAVMCVPSFRLDPSLERTS